MNTYTVSFFGHRIIENSIEIENRLERFIRTLLWEHEYVEFLVGRDGDFDQLVSSTICRCKREYRSDNSAHIWVLPYLTAEFRENEESFWNYYDEIEVCEAAAGSHYKNAQLYLEINRYDDHGNLLEEPAGYMSSNGLSDKEAETFVHAYSHPDHAYADAQLSGVKYAIERESVQNHLCQTCLDSINDLWFTDQPLAEFAIVSFEDRTIQPLLNSRPWFSAGNYGIDCEYKDVGAIDLLVHYCPFWYN